jgi:glycosyltransferase involved in cell wall biosynthesis
MDRSIEVSVIIPTYNRRTLVARAVRSAIAQTRTVEEIIVIDDGSTDGTGEALQAAFGDRVRYVWQPNAGVAAARNHGLRLARGRYLALLDSDDEWLPEKTRRQVEWLEVRPDFGMVLCDVVRMDAEHRDIEIFRRRELLPEDGDIFKWVLLEPALVPASVMLRRSAYEAVGGFDESLPTAEDLDFHLRVAAQCRIGVVEEPLVRAMRGHDGLSSLERTYDDYVRVVEAAVAASVGRVSQPDRDRALARVYARNARGMTLTGRRAEAWVLARKAWTLEPDAAARWKLLTLVPLVLRCAMAARRNRLVA